MFQPPSSHRTPLSCVGVGVPVVKPRAATVLVPGETVTAKPDLTSDTVIQDDDTCFKCGYSSCYLREVVSCYLRLVLRMIKGIFSLNM